MNDDVPKTDLERLAEAWEEFRDAVREDLLDVPVIGHLIRFFEWLP